MASAVCALAIGIILFGKVPSTPHSRPIPASTTELAPLAPVTGMGADKTSSRLVGDFTLLEQQKTANVVSQSNNDNGPDTAIDSGDRKRLLSILNKD